MTKYEQKIIENEKRKKLKFTQEKIKSTAEIFRENFGLCFEFDGIENSNCRIRIEMKMKTRASRICFHTHRWHVNFESMTDGEKHENEHRSNYLPAVEFTISRNEL